eukprot:g14909.t1
MVAVPPTASATDLHRPPSSEQGCAAAGGASHGHSSAVASACSYFGPSAPAIELRPRSSRNNHGSSSSRWEEQERRDGLPSGEGNETLKPHTGMTIRLTPELLGRLKEPGPKPKIELVLKSPEEGGPVLVVGGVPYNTNAHKMAVGSEVNILAKMHRPGGGGGSSGTAADAGSRAGQAVMSVFASLHRKLIVQQVLTEAKRAVIRARKDEIERREREAKKKIVVMEDQEEMLAAAESIPAPQGQAPQLPEGGGRKSERDGSSHSEQRRRQRRDPLMAWVCGCYNSDDYAGHVSDLRQFFRGIDFQHVMFRYHVKQDGSLDPDRRRFCVKFKTKAGRDLAIKRSGEALGSFCSWWDPEEVAVVVRGRDEDSEGGGGSGVNELLVVLPQGRSVADVLQKISTRLPPDLSPALAAQQAAAEQYATNAAGKDAGKNRKRNRKQHHNGINITDDDDAYTAGNAIATNCPNASSGYQRRQDRRRSGLEAYRRDMLRAGLGADLADTLTLGPTRGAPAAAARVAGTDENNALRVAMLAASEAARVLDVRLEEAGVGRKNPGAGRSRSESCPEEARERARRRGRGGREKGDGPSAPSSTVAAATL